MSVIAATTVIRGSQPGTSHGGVYLVDLDGQRGAHLLEWTRPSIDWSGHGGGRGLRGLAFGDDRVYVAGASELFSFAPDFALLGVLSSPYLGQAQAVACFEGRIYVVSAAYDAVLAFDLQAGRFDWGLQIVDGDSGLRGIPFDPQGTLGPPPSHELRLNSLHCDPRGLFIGGGRTMGLLHFDGKRIVRLVTLPEGVHDARPWREGVLFNDTEAEAVRFLTPDANCVFPVPHYPEAALEPGSCVDSAVARQGFARGLCVLGEGAFASGASPLTITLHDLDTMKTTLRINLSTDARHAIHSLAPWPFEAA
ncbi:MAG: hypothetical protein EHM68_10860 [Lysobacterales bacterium]|nr:MAG: hypothetical protein EHM68_10860 [Xanthomonadales bacterium]